jgi:putative flippase GtrA
VSPTSPATHPAAGLIGQALRFGLVGLANTAVGLGVTYAAMAFGGAGPYAANGLGYAVGLCVSFVLNRRWTFRSTGAPRREAARFLTTFAVAYGVNLAVLHAAVAGLGVDPYLAQPIAMAFYTAIFFVLSRAFVFAGRPGRSPDGRLAP